MNEKSSFFNSRCKCLHLNKSPTLHMLAELRENVKSSKDELTPDIFTYMIFTQGLTADEDAEVRVKILAKLEENQSVNF